MSGDAGKMFMPDADSATRGRMLRRLARRYFRKTAAAVLDPRLRRHGFRRTGFSREQLVYRRGSCVLKFGFFSHQTDHVPKYSLTGGIGISGGLFRKDQVVPLWRVPKPDYRPSAWEFEFGGERQLAKSVRKLANMLERYGRPLWDDDERLRDFIDREWPKAVEYAQIT